MSGIREEKKQLTRQAILAAGDRLFRSRGYDNTSISALAAEAGVGKGTVYSYFRTKQEVFLAFCRAQLFRAHNQIVASADTNAPVIDQMMAVFAETFRFACQDKEFGRLLLRESFFPDQQNLEQSQKIEDLYIEMLVPFLKRAQERGELRPELDLTLVIGHFYGLYLITISAWFSGRLKRENEFYETLHQLLQQAMYGLSPVYLTENCDACKGKP